MTDAKTLDQPSGGFDWMPELPAPLPILRGIRASEFKLPDYPCGELAAAWSQEVYRDSVRSRWALLVGSGQAPRELPWTDDEARGHIAPEALARPDLAA